MDITLAWHNLLTWIISYHSAHKEPRRSCRLCWLLGLQYFLWIRNLIYAPSPLEGDNVVYRSSFQNSRGTHLFFFLCVSASFVFHIYHCIIPIIITIIIGPREKWFLISFWLLGELYKCRMAVKAALVNATGLALIARDDDESDDDDEDGRRFLGGTPPAVWQLCFQTWSCGFYLFCLCSDAASGAERLIPNRPAGILHLSGAGPWK